VDQATYWVEVAELETGELSDAETAKGADEDECAISRVDGVGEPHHLIDGERCWFVALDLG